MKTQAVMFVVGASLLAGAGCKWTEFDDLEQEAWVEATEKPENDSASWGVALARSARAGSGGRLAVFGTSEAVYTELAYTANGDVSVAGNSLELNSQFGIGNLDAQPIVLADPASDDVALVTTSGSASIAILRGAAGQLVAHQVFGPARPDAATYMVPPPTTGFPAPTLSQTLVAQDDRVYGTFFNNPPNPQPSCKLVDAGNQPVLVRALGAMRLPDGTDDVIVWSSTGQLLRYPGGVFNGALSIMGCDTGVAPSASAATDTTLAPGAGSQILTFETRDGGNAITGNYAVLQGHDDAGMGLLALYDLGTLDMIGSARTDNGVKTAALFESGGKRYVLAGYPAAIIDGTVAGQALVFEVDATSGIAASPALTLHDAQPEDNQLFGRAVAVMPFDGKPVIVVGADNEVFAYYRTNLYPDVRAGR